MRTGILKHAVLALLLAAGAACLAACHGGTKPDMAQAADVPTSFDVTLLADKDGQFDYDGAPLTLEDMMSALRYRKEQHQPIATIVLKPGEKQKIKNQHIVGLARIVHDMGVKAYIDQDGVISSVQAAVKTK